MEQADNDVGKPKPKAGDLIQQSTQSFQENVTRAGPLAAASYTLIGAIILLGSIGYAMDRWLGASPWFLLGGLLVALIVGFYELGKVAFRQ